MPCAFAEKFPECTGVRWFNLMVLVITPSIAAYGVWKLEFNKQTFIFAAAYYLFSMLGKVVHSLL